MQLNFSVKDYDIVDPIDMIDEDGTILTREGDITFCWELTLPVAGNVGREVYEAMHRAANAAVRLLPDWSMVHRQDLYLDESYKPRERDLFLDRCYEKHFAGRRYTEGRHYLYLTMSTKSSITREPTASGLFGLRLAKSLPSESTLLSFAAKADEFITVFCGGTPVRARRLTQDDLCGTPGGGQGLISKVRFLGGERSDIWLEPDMVRSGENRAIAYSIACSDNLPAELDTVAVEASHSTELFESVSGLASPLGISFPEYPHICNLYISKVNQEVHMKDLDKKILHQGQFSSDGMNRINAEENMEFKDAAGSDSLCAVLYHCNVIVWSTSAGNIPAMGSRLSAAFTAMGASVKRDIHSLPMLWYASLPGAACSLSKSNYVKGELRTALALAQYESFDHGIPGGILRFTDRIRHIPLDLDAQKAAADANLVANYNIFLNGPSGTGKSFTTSTMLYRMWASGQHVFVIDIGGSYEQVCTVIHEESGGVDGIYNRWDALHPFSFNPFRGCREWLTPEGLLQRDNPAANFLISLLLTLGTDADKGIILGNFEDNILASLVVEFVRQWSEPSDPIFDDFVAWIRSRLLYGEDEPQESLRGTMRPFITPNGVRVDERTFPAGFFVESISAYASGGQFGFLLNATNPKDLFSSRFTVFDVTELSNVSNQKFYSICVLCIVNAFDVKMRSKDVSGFKVMAIDEAWKAIANETMAPYLRELWKTARKMNTSAMVITQQLEDIISSPIIKDTILLNSDIKMLLNQDQYRNTPEKIADLLGLSPGDLSLVFSMAGKDSQSRDIFIKWSSVKSGVYTVEGCLEQRWAFESNLQKKAPLMELAQKNGSIIRSIEELSQRGVKP